MLLTGNIAALITPGFRVIWGNEMAKWEEEYSKIFDLETSTRNYEEDHSVTSLGRFVSKAQGAAITYDTVYDGFTKRYTHGTWGLGFSVSREMIDDDLYRRVKNMPKDLAVSAQETVEVEAANIINRAFTAGYTGGDGVVLGSASHPLYGGGTFSNMPSVSADLDVSSYEQALIDIQMNFVDDRSMLKKVLPQKLIIHPANYFMAQKILKSASEPDTANNAINPAQGTMPGGIVVMHYMTDTDAWHIKTNAPHGLKFIWRDRPEFTQDNDFDTENAKYKGRMRFICGWTNPRGLYCVTGA